MPYNPGISDQSGQYLYGGLSSFGSSVGQGIAEAAAQLRKDQEAKGADDIILQYAKANQMLPPEAESKYLTGNISTKNGIVAGLVRKFALDMQQQQLKSLQEERAAQSQERLQKAAAFNFTPRMVTLPSPTDAQGFPFAQPVNQAQAVPRPGVQLVETQKGKFEVAPGAEGADSVPQVEPFVDPTTGQPVPGWGIARMKGSKQFQVVPFGSQGGVQIELDPQTGIPFYRDNKGNPHPLNTQQIMSGKMLAPPPPQAQSGSNTMNAIKSAWDAIGSIGGGDVTPTPAPVATPGQVSVAPTYGVRLSDQDQQALAWAKSNPKDPRSAKILAKLGLTQ